MSLNIEVPYNQGAGLYLPLTGGALTGPLALGANKITGLANGTAPTDAATFGQVQTTEAALNPALQYEDILGWAYDPTAGNSEQLLWGGPAHINLVRIPLPVAMTVTNVLCHVTTLGLTLTHSYLALFTSNGTVIGQSVDQSTAWGATGATGLYTLPLVGGPFVCTPLAANDFLWAAWYEGTAITRSKMLIANNNISGDNYLSFTSAPRSRFGYIAQADTATLASIVLANVLPMANALWLGIS
jgi:hypothetical protein